MDDGSDEIPPERQVMVFVEGCLMLGPGAARKLAVGKNGTFIGPCAGGDLSACRDNVIIIGDDRSRATKDDQLVIGNDDIKEIKFGPLTEFFAKRPPHDYQDFGRVGDRWTNFEGEEGSLHFIYTGLHRKALA